MNFKSFLSAAVHDFGVVFSFLGSAKGQATVAGVETAANAAVGAINPGLSVAMSSVEALINSALKQVIAAETAAVAAGSQSGTGAQKAAAVVGAIAPDVTAILKSVGVSQPTSDQVQAVATAVNNGLVAVLNAIPAPPSAA